MRRTFQITRRHLLQGSAAALATPMLGTGASAQSAWPNRPVRVVVPYPPAGGADTTARLFFTKLGEMWGAQFVIDNRGGAGGTIAAAAVAKADPDGYTIMHDATAHSVNPALYSNLSFNYTKDFAPVFLVSLVPNILVANTDVPDKTLADVIEAAKKTPGGLDFASSGNGTLQHLSLEMLKHMAKVPINHVPYRGGGPALNDIVGGQIKYYFSNGSASVGLIQGGKVKAIVHTGKGRLGTLPDLPAAQDTLPRLRGLRVERRVCAGRYARRHRQEAERRTERGAQAARHQGALEAAQHRFPRQHAGRIPRVRGG